MFSFLSHPGQLSRQSKISGSYVRVPRWANFLGQTINPGYFADKPDHIRSVLFDTVETVQKSFLQMIIFGSKVKYFDNGLILLLTPIIKIKKSCYICGRWCVTLVGVVTLVGATTANLHLSKRGVCVQLLTILA